MRVLRMGLVLASLALTLFISAANAQSRSASAPAASASEPQVKWVYPKTLELPPGYEAIGKPHKTLTLSCPRGWSRQCQSTKICNGNECVRREICGCYFN
jgi:hypothetical protein